MTPKAWADLQGQIVQDRARHDWTAKHTDWATAWAVPRHEGRVAEYDDLLDGMDRIVRSMSLVSGWAEFRAGVKRDWRLWYGQAGACEPERNAGAQVKHAYGRAAACSEVLAYMDSAEKEASR